MENDKQQIKSCWITDEINDLMTKWREMRYSNELNVLKGKLL